MKVTWILKVSSAKKVKVKREKKKVNRAKAFKSLINKMLPLKE